MNQKSTLGVWRSAAAVASLLMALSLPSLAFAQNCPLCYTQAASSGARVIQALRSGIFILVIPAMLICTGIAIMAFRKRNEFHDR
jgi:hypothetical protein